MSRSSAHSARSSACESGNASSPRACAAITIQPGYLFQFGSTGCAGPKFGLSAVGYEVCRESASQCLVDKTTERAGARTVGRGEV